MLSQFRSRSLANSTRSYSHSFKAIYNALRLVWVVLVMSGELGAFFWSLWGCRWPSLDVGHTKSARKKIKPAHVLLIADTQIQHPAMLADGSSWANPIRRVLFELNMRKNWHVTSRLRPHAVVFLGDMLANGKASRSLKEYMQAVQKFKSLFELPSDMEVYHIPGNNDVGLGLTTSQDLRSYYTQTFGPLNQKFVIANHTFVALDAPGLVDEDYKRHAKHVSFDEWKPIPDGPVSFVKEVAQVDPEHVILLSHIPLARAETANCGPGREKGTIFRGAGPGYQSMLGKQTTSFLLRTLKPIVVFSGDNRDYCDHIHVVPGARQDAHNPDGSVREVTVKSFSMSVHIQRPGFQLLSLVDPAQAATPDTPTYADELCLLPDQFRIYTSFYMPCFLITLFLLFVFNLRKGKPKPLKKLDRLAPLAQYSGSSGPNTPNVLVSGDAAPWSAAWSSFSPIMPTSPRTPLPSYLRTPRVSSGSTTHLVASLPGTPAPSSPTKFLSPMPYAGDDDGEDDTMYPTQYAMRRDSIAPRDEEEWSHIEHSHGKDEDYEVIYDQEKAIHNLAASPRHQPEFISAPVRAKVSVVSKKKSWSWSYTFVLKGRRRRVVLRLPSLTSLHNFLDLVGLSGEATLGTRRRRGGPTGIVVDVLSVFWPATVVWVIINWTIL